MHASRPRRVELIMGWPRRQTSDCRSPSSRRGHSHAANRGSVVCTNVDDLIDDVIASGAIAIPRRPAPHPLAVVPRWVSSNLHPSGFDELMPKTLVTATVDRLLHHAHLCKTTGESVRLAWALAAADVAPPAAPPERPGLGPPPPPPAPPPAPTGQDPAGGGPAPRGPSPPPTSPPRRHPVNGRRSPAPWLPQPLPRPAPEPSAPAPTPSPSASTAAPTNPPCARPASPPAPPSPGGATGGSTSNSPDRGVESVGWKSALVRSGASAPGGCCVVPAGLLNRPGSGGVRCPGRSAGVSRRKP